MKNILNIIFSVLKYILLIGAFGVTLFIILQMNHRLNKPFTSVIPVFLPYVILFILFLLNFILKQKGVINSLFYNLTSCLVLCTILVVGYRSFADKNMVLNEIYGYGIDFNYFNNFIAYMKIMLYGLSLSNVLLMFQPKEEKEEN